MVPEGPNIFVYEMKCGDCFRDQQGNLLTLVQLILNGFVFSPHFVVLLSLRIAFAKRF